MMVIIMIQFFKEASNMIPSNKHRSLSLPRIEGGCLSGNPEKLEESKREEKS